MNATSGGNRFAPLRYGTCPFAASYSDSNAKCCAVLSMRTDQESDSTHNTVMET